MRFFEAVLLIVNLLSLLAGVTRQSKLVWRVAAGVNLVVLLVHGVFEGLRYQMVFSYAFVAVFVLYTLIKTSGNFFKASTPKALKGIGIGLATVLLLAGAFLAIALPVFRLPQPTGPHDVGVEYFHLIDESRTEPFLDGSTRPRELMVKVYYPAQDDASKRYARYFNGSRDMLRQLTTAYNLPIFLFDHLSLVKMHSKEGLALSDAQETYPIVLFSHGGGTTMEVHAAQSEDLASHGSIVVAIDHTYASAGTIFPDHVVSARDATTVFDSPEPVDIIDQIMADDSSFVIDQLEAMNDGSLESRFQGRLDMDAIGAAGHSLGGAVAYNLAINDSRVMAAINLDGRVFVTPEDGGASMAPFLMLADDKVHTPALENRESLLMSFDEMPELDQEITASIYGSREAYQEYYDLATRNATALADVLAESGNLYTIEGSSHMKFADIGMFFGIPQIREVLAIDGKTEPRRVLEITQAVTVVFFDQHLKGEGDSLESVVEKYPELRQVDLP
jgi:predicted dienelactone hydrolase